MDIMKQIVGNLLEIESGIICHQVNCLGAMGGLAGAIKQKYPAACREYIQKAKAGKVLLGDCLVAYPTDTLVLCHMAGQFNIGPNTNMHGVWGAFEKLARYLTVAMREDKQVYIPYMMGCGLGGGDWDDYQTIVGKLIPDAIVVARPEDLERFKV